MRLVLFAGLLAFCCLIPSAAHSAGLSTPGYTPEEQQLWNAYQEGTIIRLHILAENDSPIAQEIKLRVRDAVLNAFSGSLSSQDPDALYMQLQENVDEMRLVAEETARRGGFVGEVNAQVAVMALPAKRYGQVLLPEGPYRALRITLGKGEGRNWWCVLFPSLCLAVADDEPWRTPEAEKNICQEEGQMIQPIIWDSQQIFQDWLCLPQGF